MKKLIAALVAGLLLTACQNKNEYSTELHQIDSLQSVLKTYRMQFDSVDAKAVTELSDHVDTQYQVVLDNYPDSADHDFWTREVNYFGHVNRGLNRYEENAEQIDKDLAYSTSQINDLAKGIKEGQLDSAEVQKYLREEIQAMQAWEVVYLKTVPETQRAFVLWDSLQPRYDSIANYWRSAP